jgi:molybdopterin converting factor small subunit
MKIRAFFHGILADWVGTPQAEFLLPDGGNFGDLLSEIKKAHGTKIPPQLSNKSQEEFNRAVWAMRGQEKLTEPTTKLKDGEEIKFFLTLAGG